MIIIIIRMMTMMIIGTTTIMIMIIIITTTLTMTIMKMIMIKTAQTPCQSLYKDRRIQNKIAWYNWYNRNDVMLILYEMLHTCSIMHTQWRCKFENTKHWCLGMFLHKCNLHCSGRNWYKRGFFFSKAILNSLSVTCFSFISFYSELMSLYISTPYTYQVWK